jgi:hypothetical protein
MQEEEEEEEGQRKGRRFGSDWTASDSVPCSFPRSRASDDDLRTHKAPHQRTPRGSKFPLETTGGGGAGDPDDLRETGGRGSARVEADEDEVVDRVLVLDVE